MKSARAPILLLALLYAGFVALVWLTREQLPERVASHFGASGRADGWMSRDSHVRYVMTFGLVFPMVVPAICYCVRFLPAALINIPRREYWLAPERKAETTDYLFRHSLWLGCLAVCFIAGSHWMVVDANLSIPPRLSTPLLASVAGGFIVGLVCWVGVLLRRFLRVKQ